jgi:hypothetical protein
VNRLATIEPTAGISLPLQVKHISSCVPISDISQYWEAYFRYKSQNPWFPVENAGKLSAMNLNGLSAISTL